MLGLGFGIGLGLGLGLGVPVCLALCFQPSKPCVASRTPCIAGDELSILPACAHTFHAACVARWLKDKPSCPVCMRDCRQDVR